MQVAYAIGVVEPVSILVDSGGSAKVDDSVLTACVKELFRLTPKGITESLDLLRPIYRKTSTYGHFGRELPGFSWEKVDRVEEIQDFCKFKPGN